VTEALVVASGLHKRFGEVRAVDDVSVTILPGEIVGVAGPNGSGKSTLARLLLGFAAPDSGVVRVGGLDPAIHREASGVGYLREDGARGWDRLTPRALLGLRCDPDGTRARELGELLKLDALAVRPIRDLSKGQWRLCQLWFALAGESPFVVLDEPEAGLDPAALERLRSAVLATASRGAAVFVLSHHLDEMARTVGTVMFMSRGKLRGAVSTEGRTAAELRDDYRRWVEAP
jgi:ABC-type multidrug transport system ATPase subunit